MSSPDQDRYWMQRALELARRGIAVTSPNPAVGCVILDRAGQVGGEGRQGRKCAILIRFHGPKAQLRHN
jgi:pyrimidine deaminase RibD-like protein